MEQVAAAWDYFWRVSVNISDGLGVTLGLFALTLLFSIPLGLIISLGAISRFKPLSWLVKFYIWLLRGTPLLLQLLFVYFGLPLVFQLLFDYFNLPLQFNIDNFTAAVVAFVLRHPVDRQGTVRGGEGAWPVERPDNVARYNSAGNQPDSAPGGERVDYAGEGHLACVDHRAVGHHAPDAHDRHARGERCGVRRCGGVLSGYDVCFDEAVRLSGKTLLQKRTV